MAGGLYSARPGFTVVLVNIQAAQDGTIVDLDLDANGAPDGPPITLDEGEQFTQISGITNSGGQIQASGPIQVQVLATDPAANFEARGYTLVPVSDWTDDYVAPRSSSGDFWLYNPDPTTPLNLTVNTTAGSTPLIIQPNSTAKFPPVGLSPATGTHFSSDDGRPFYGVAALDPASTRDWGYSLLPVANLTTQKLVGWAPGNNNNPPGPGNGGTGLESRIYVSALTTTTIRVDFDNDGTPDQDFLVTPLAEVPITDPDFDLTGAMLYTEDGTPFVAVWGQDQTASPALPSIDAGTAIVPLPSLALQKSLELVNDADGTGTPTWGDTVRFEIFVVNTSRTILNPVTISDNLPPSTTYVPDSTTVGGTSVADGTGGTTFPLEAGYDVVLAPLGSITATFDVTINSNTDSVANTASASNPNLPPATGTVGVPIKVADYELDKRLISPADGQANRGDVITYNLVITSTGNISITKMPLRDAVDPAQLTFLNATPPPDIVTAGVITWTDLATTSLFGPLDPNRTIVLTTSYKVNNVAADVTSLTNTATVEGAQGADGSPLPTKSDQAEVQVPPLEASYIFDKRLISPADGQSAPGETVIFGLTITNTGSLSLTKMSLRDTYNKDHLIFENGDPSPDQVDPGQIFWQDLTNNFGDLLPGQTINLTTTYTVNPNLTGVPDTNNVATVEGVEDSLGRPLDPQTDGVDVFFPSPPTDGGNDDDDDDGGEPPAVPSPPTATPTPQASALNPPGAPVPPEETPTLPVTFLPETGITDVSPDLRLLTVLGLLVGSLAGIVIWKSRRK